jgi:hypothetical protein
MIWRESMPGPRIIKFQIGPSNTPQAVCKIPALLQICHETREEYCKIYELVYPSQLEGKSIRIDFSRDAVYFKEDRLLPPFCQFARFLENGACITELEAKLQYIIVSGDPLIWICQPFVYIQGFRSLKEIIFDAQMEVQLKNVWGWGLPVQPRTEKYIDHFRKQFGKQFRGIIGGDATTTATIGFLHGWAINLMIDNIKGDYCS